MKKLFVGLLTIIGLLFTSFGHCEVVEDLVSYIGGTNTVSINGNSYYTILDLGSSGNPGTYCVYISERQGGNNLRFGFNSSLSWNNEMSYSLYSWWGTPLYACLYVDTQYMFFYNATSQNIDLTYKVFKLNALMNTNLPVFTSQECQSEYNLIPISSVDTNYCQNNNLCPVCNGGSGDCSGDNWSSLFINNIQHQSSPLINITIPDYITWDYVSNEDYFDLYVGSGYDLDYIESVIDINSYRPSSGDFTDVFVSGLTLILPYVFIALFILFVWKLIKKIFK